jgi:hypothetical protein
VIEKRITFEGHPPALRYSGLEKRENARPHIIFLLSPASSGIRARILFSPHARFELAQRLNHSGATLGEVYSFISGLYFRGKLAYAERFKNPPPGIAGVHVITAAAGLLLPQALMTLPLLRTISATRVDPANPDYRRPLDRDALRLRALLEPDTQVVLLGSIANPKYVLPLLEVFGERLFFPKEFVGRGDMSRGSLLLRCCSQGSPLEYAPVAGAIRHGRRPRKFGGSSRQS